MKPLCKVNELLILFSDTYVIAFRSVILDSLPPFPEYHRAEVRNFLPKMLILSHIMLKNGQIYFKDIVVQAPQDF